MNKVKLPISGDLIHLPLIGSFVMPILYKIGVVQVQSGFILTTELSSSNKEQIFVTTAFSI